MAGLFPLYSAYVGGLGLGACVSILFFYAWLLSFCFRGVHFYRLGIHFYRRINLKSSTETYQYSCPVVFTQILPFKIFDHCWNTFLLVTTLINSFYPEIMTFFFLKKNLIILNTCIWPTITLSVLTLEKASC